MQLTKPIFAVILSVFLLLLAVIVLLLLKLKGFFSSPPDVRTEEVVMAELCLAVDACKADFDNNPTIFKVLKNYSCKEGDEESALKSWSDSIEEKGRISDNVAAIRLLKFALLLQEMYFMKYSKCKADPDIECEIKMGRVIREIPRFAMNLVYKVMQKFGLNRFTSFNPHDYFLIFSPEELIENAVDKDQREAAKMYITNCNNCIKASTYYNFGKLREIGKEKTKEVIEAL